MIINHKKLNQTPKKNYEIVLHAMHCGGGVFPLLKTFLVALASLAFKLSVK